MQMNLTHTKFNENWISSTHQFLSVNPDLRSSEIKNINNCNFPDPNFQTSSDRDFINCQGGYVQPFNLSALDDDYYAVDTCNSNCVVDKQSSFNKSNKNQENISFNGCIITSTESNKEKKFVSELHINIKEPIYDDTESQEQNIMTNFTSRNTGVHCSSFETFIGNNRNVYENHENSMDNESESSESEDNPIREFHSEKFIFLGCNKPKSTKFNLADEDIQSIEAQTDNCDECSNSHDNVSLKSDEDEESNEPHSDYKVFSTKSVQTSKKFDCILKTVCDKSIETDQNRIQNNVAKNIMDNLKESNIPSKDRNQQILSSASENILPDESLNDDRNVEIPIKIPAKTPINKFDKVISKPNEIKKIQSAKQPNKSLNESNQDTNPSCSQSFTSSNIEEIQHNKIDGKFINRKTNSNTKRNLSSVSKNLKLKKDCLKVSRSNVESKICDKNHVKKSFSIFPNSSKNDLRDHTKSSGGQKEENERNYEIQNLLDNLNTHLQNTVKCHSKASKLANINNKTNGASNANLGVHTISQGSFWDNPLSLEGIKSMNCPMMNIYQQNRPNIDPKVTNDKHKSINPEIQAIFDTLEKKQLNQTQQNNQERTEGTNKMKMNKAGSRKSLDRSLQKFNSGSKDALSVKSTINNNGDSRIDLSVNNPPMQNPNRTPANFRNSGDNLFSHHETLTLDPRFPPSMKYQRSFDLSPYDELVKSHLNTSDRRIKSVAAKNGCKIAIDGPISLVDPTSTCQAIRNKVSYRCLVAGSSKERLDKCLNYLKETFPNTCLRLHGRK